MNYTYKISFDNIEWEDLSLYINSNETTLKKGMISTTYQSSINTLKFSLTVKPRNTDVIADLVIRLLDALVSKKTVYINFYEGLDIIFSGVLDNSGISGKIAQHADNISITAFDKVYLLDKKIEESFEYPSDFTTDTDGYYVFKNNINETQYDIVVTLLKSAGFTLDDIDFTNSSPVMRNDNNSLYRTCRHIAYDKDDARTYRDILDTLLLENCKVLTTGADGRFQIKDIYPIINTDNIPNLGRNYEVVNDSFSYKCSRRKEDGIQLEWSTLATINTLIYDANLGGTVIADGSGFEGGLTMDGLSYYPPTSDLEEVWQEYSSSWLDRAYYTATSRLQNKDVSLLSAKNVTWEQYSDPEIELDTGYPYAESLRVMFRFKNTSVDKKEFHRFAIYGDCLYRYKLNTYTYPTLASIPEDYSSEFIFTQEQAQEFTLKIAKLKNYGIMQYTWSQYLPINEGEVWHVEPSKSRINTNTLITSITISFKGGKKRYSITAQGFGDYTTDEIRKKAIINGSTTGNIGKDGTNGTSVVVEYAKNTSATNPPEGDTAFIFGTNYMLFQGMPMGYPVWSRTAPLASELSDNEYIWQRNSK